MISQLDGLVKALQKKQRDEGTLVSVHASSPSPARVLAERLARVHNVLLLSVRKAAPTGTADWNTYLNGGALEPATETGSGLSVLASNGDYPFPAWATGETARRLLEGVRYSGCPWKYIICDAGMEPNESSLVLGSAADWIYLEIPSAPWEQACAYNLLQTLAQRNKDAAVAFAPAADLEESTALWVGREFSGLLETSVKQRLLNGGDPVQELTDWIAAQNNEEDN